MSFGLTNAPTVFMDLLNTVFKPYLDMFVIIFIENIQINSRNEEDHASNLRIVLKTLIDEGCVQIFLSVSFGLTINS